MAPGGRAIGLDMLPEMLAVASNVAATAAYRLFGSRVYDALGVEVDRSSSSKRISLKRLATAGQAIPEAGGVGRRPP